MELNKLKPKKGARHAKKRVGRGPGSGHGKTSGKGEKGQKSRSGFSRALGFEGGQMPLHRRLPKRGFTNIFKREFAIVNLEKLKSFPAGSSISPEVLLEKRIIRNVRDGVKILGNGELPHALNVAAHFFSKSAREKIARAGGKVEVLK